MAKINATFKRGFKTKAESISLEYRANLNLDPWAPMCAFALATFLKIPIYSPSDFFNSTSDIEQLCGSDSNDTGWSALIMNNSVGLKMIIHNTQHSPQRQQSNVMHEIAHILCNHEIPEQYKNMSLPFAMPYHNDQQEAEAAYLGAALQLSKPCLFWALKRDMTYSNMAEHYNASVEMVKYRINISGVGFQKGILKRKKSIS